MNQNNINFIFLENLLLHINVSNKEQILLFIFSLCTETPLTIEALDGRYSGFYSVSHDDDNLDVPGE